MILAIDPGDVRSSYAIIDGRDQIPYRVGELPNDRLLERLRFGGMQRGEFGQVDLIVCEMVASYGMPVGREVFDTCVWIGRFVQAAAPREVGLVFRREVKLHLCGTARAKDGNIIQALVDRFAPGANGS